MPSLHFVSEEESSPAAVARARRVWPLWTYLLTGAVLAAAVGTWLIWFSIYLQRKVQTEDIRAACHRAMPDTADRCFDTVVIQRGGVRR